MSDKMSAAQQRLWDAMADGLRVYYWPAGWDPCHWAMGRKLGHYSYAAKPKGVTCSTIEAMRKKGLLVVVRRFDGDATASGKNAAMELARADELRAASAPKDVAGPIQEGE